MPTPSLKWRIKMTPGTWTWQGVYAEAKPIAARLRFIREEHFKTVVRLAEAERKFKVLEACKEQTAVNDAGGEKGLGSNAPARTRALLIALAGDDELVEPRGALITLRLTCKQYEAEVLSLRDSLSLHKAALYANAGLNEV